MCFPSSEFVRLLSPPKHLLVKAGSNSGSVFSSNTTPFEALSLPVYNIDFHSFEPLRVETVSRIESRPQNVQGAYSWVCPESAELVTTPVRMEDNDLLLGDMAGDSETPLSSTCGGSASFFDGWTFPAFTSSADSTPLSVHSNISLSYSLSAKSAAGAGASLLGDTPQHPFASSSAAPWAVTDSSEDDSPAWLRG